MADVTQTGTLEDQLAAREMQVRRLEEENARLRDVLRVIEWVPTPDGFGDGECPQCYAYRRGGHERDCKLAAVLEGK